ncbi:MAG TPA: glycosyltransferase, partial [Rugosimonospora sp.]|nr:glycosyltransferase [Rugosimonospora sp.]
CHTEERWDSLVRAVESVQAQTAQPAEIVVVVDHNPRLFARAWRELTGVTVLANGSARGVSGNRNTGVFHTSTPIVALLDDDAYAHPGWLAALVEPFLDASVIGTGGAIHPAWEQPRPSWFPEEFLWTVGGSEGGGQAPTPRRNVWSASMAVRRDAFEAVGGFRVGFGKLGNRARPEDTELCLRMSQASGGRWMYVPAAVIDHPVPPERSRFSYFLSRCYHEGRGKVEMSRVLGGTGNLTAEQEYLSHTLPRAVGRALVDTVRGRGLANAVRAGAVVTGVAAAAAGGAVELMRAQDRRPLELLP